VIMIGAGFFLAGSKTGRDLTQKASDLAEEMSDEARRRAHDLGDQVSKAASDAANFASDAVDRTREAVASGASRLQQTGQRSAEAARAGAAAQTQAVQDTAGEWTTEASRRTDDLKDKMSQVADASTSAVQDALSSAAGAAQATAARTAQTGREFIDATRSRLTEAGQRTSGTLRETIEQNPLLVASVGLLVGGLIASALRKVSVEERLFGSASRAMRQQARHAAAAGLAAAKGTADEAMGNVARQAEAEGLTPEGMARGARDAGQRLQRVAERAVTTAFDPDTHPDDNGGGKQHG